MVVIELTEEQHEILLKLVADKCKEIHAWMCSLQSSLRAEELQALENLCYSLKQDGGKR